MALALARPFQADKGRRSQGKAVVAQMRATLVALEAHSSRPASQPTRQPAVGIEVAGQVTKLLEEGDIAGGEHADESEVMVFAEVVEDNVGCYVAEIAEVTGYGEEEGGSSTAVLGRPGEAEGS